VSVAEALANGYEFKPLGRYRADLGESPFVSADGHHVWWVDTSGKRLFRTSRLAGGEEVWHLPEQVGFVAEAWGTCVVGMESGLFAFDPSGATLTAVPHSAPGSGMRYNDACVDARGGLWAGTMDLDAAAPAGVLLHFPQPDERRVIDFGYRRINGLAHDAARRRLWLSDSHPDIRTIWTMNLDATDMASSRAAITTLKGSDGRPDGACLDLDGRYWVATLEGRSILHPAEGSATLSLGVPVALPTKVAMDVDGRVYVTSKRSTDADDSLGGYLLVGTARRGAMQ